MFHNHYADKKAYEDIIKFAKSAQTAREWELVRKQMEFKHSIYGTTVTFCRVQEMITNMSKD